MHAESRQSNSVIQTVRHAIQLLVAQMSVAQTSGNCLSDVCMCMFVFVSIMLQCGAKRLSKYTYMLNAEIHWRNCMSSKCPRCVVQMFVARILLLTI